MRNLAHCLADHARRCPPRGYLLALLLMFSGCAAPPPTVKPAPEVLPSIPAPSEAPLPPGVAEPEAAAPSGPDTTGLEKMALDGRFLDAALGYIRLAAEFPAPLAQEYQLRAAELLITGNYVLQAEQQLESLKSQTLPVALDLRRSLLSARVALARRNPQAALSALGSATYLLATGDPQHQIEIHQLRAAAFEQQGRPVDAARARVELEPLLSDVLPEMLSDAAIEANQQGILQVLKKMPAASLRSQGTEGKSATLLGWIELAAISQGDNNLEQAGRALSAWRGRYPQHPALDSILNEILAARPTGIAPPQQIALILPLNNKFAAAATAIRDGFLTAYYAQREVAPPGQPAPRVRVYDEGDDPGQIEAIAARAMSEGAQFIVGPLDKEAVNRLAQKSTLPTPVLALNFSELSEVHAASGPQGGGHLYQLSLSPEQEAQQVAERAWLDGHVRAAVLTPNTSWGERVTDAFLKRWQTIGGELVESQLYEANDSDYSLPIRKLLNIDDSEDRRTALARQLGIKLEFTPRRRQDVDFIFMAASPRQARLIRPQLRFHHAATVPVYTTSNSYTGVINVEMDRDMDGVIFSDIPWTLGSTRAGSDLKQIVESQWPGSAKLYSRLFALGIDAYNVIGELDRLQHNRADFFAGVTGDLYLDTDNRLQRRMQWARFQNGVPRLLDNL